MMFADHITREKLERILAVIQGTNHKALLMYVCKETAWLCLPLQLVKV